MHHSPWTSPWTTEEVVVTRVCLSGCSIYSEVRNSSAMQLVENQGMVCPMHKFFCGKMLSALLTEL